MQPGRNYLPHIDGLRAFAVLVVIFFHYEIASFPGSFLSVDIFFVISGFLISKNISEDLEKNQWSFKKFYIRRIWRIIPALFTTIGITFLLFSVLLTPDDLVHFAKSCIAAVFSFSNIFFWKDPGYFVNVTDLRPLIHTWTLGVEEQFYFLWPAILVFLSKLKNKKAARFILIAVFSFSVVSAEYLAKSNPRMAFYLVPFRLFEFLVGYSLVGLIKKDFSSRLARELLSLTGLALIMFSFLLLDEKSPLPGLLSLPVCIGTGLIILAAENTYLVGAVLQNRMMAGIGLISYSLYLIHWPVWVFFTYSVNRNLSGSVSIYEKLVFVLLSLGLAVLSYFFVEQVFRKNREFQTKKWIKIAAGYAAVITVLSINMISSGGWKWRLSKDVLAMYQAGSSEYPDQKVILCVGDSTTAYGFDESYPYLLQQKLNQLYGEKKFKVINSGSSGKNSLGILNKLADDIGKFKPDYIITMVGINDLLVYEEQPSLLSHLNIARLFKIWKLNLLGNEPQLDFDPINDFSTPHLIKDLSVFDAERKAAEAFKSNDFSKAEELYLNLPEGHVASESMLWNLAVIKSQEGQKKEANDFFSKLLKIRNDAKVNFSVAWYYANHYPAEAPEIKMAFNYLKKSLELDPDNFYSLHLMGQILKNKMNLLDEAEVFYLKAGLHRQCNLGITVGLADLYTRQQKVTKAMEILKNCSYSEEKGSYELWRRLITLLIESDMLAEAQDYLSQAKKRFPDFAMLSLLENKLAKKLNLGLTPGNAAISKNSLSNAFTVKNYQDIAGLIQKHNIKHIVMQYPLREIESLKDTLKDYKNLTYIQNIENFKESLARFGWDKIFTDNFAQDFGHSTRLGNELIVNQIIKTLVSEKVLPVPDRL